LAIFAPIKELLIDNMPEFLLKPFFINIYKVLPFCICLFLSINLKMHLIGLCIIVYILFKIIHLIFMYILYIWKSFRIKKWYSSRFLRLFNIFYLPLKVIKSFIIIYIVYSLINSIKVFIYFTYNFSNN